MRKSMLGLMILALAGASPAHAQSAKSGVEAWQRGDSAGAVAIWKPLAAKGDSDAAFNLGQAYRLGKGVPINLGEAQKWFEVAARRGHVDAQATLGLLLFQSGNRVAAVRWLKSAADAGEPRAMLMLGTALYNGDGVPEDPVTGYAWVSRSAAMGLVPAKATLADMDQVMPLDQRQKGVALAQAMIAKPRGKAAAPAATRSALPKTVAVTPKPSAKPATKPAAVALTGNWRIQLGAFAQRGSAESLFARLEPKLGGRQAYFVPVGKVIRLQAGPFATKAAAASVCAAVRPTPCFPVAAP